MSQQQPEAVTPSAVTGPATGNDAPPEAVAKAVAVVPMRRIERAGNALGRHAAELWLHPDRLLHSLYHGKPGSMAGHIASTKSLGWVPPDMTGKSRTFWTWAGVIYRMTIGLLLKNLGNGISAAGDCFFVAVPLIAAVILLIVLL